VAHRAGLVGAVVVVTVSSAGIYRPSGTELANHQPRRCSLVLHQHAPERKGLAVGDGRGRTLGVLIVLYGSHIRRRHRRSPLGSSSRTGRSKQKRGREQAVKRTRLRATKVQARLDEIVALLRTCASGARNARSRAMPNHRLAAPSRLPQAWPCQVNPAATFSATAMSSLEDRCATCSVPCQLSAPAQRIRGSRYRVLLVEAHRRSREMIGSQQLSTIRFGRSRPSPASWVG
jgi:hypothetical protein